MFLKNAWYVAAGAAEVGQAPLGRVILNEPIVLYRADSGAVAFEDRCCHRRAPLSKGRVEGNALRCGYHGLLFNPAGECIEVPGQSRVPRSARVRVYPICEKHRWIWIWMGDPAQADPALIPDLHHNDAPGWKATGGHLVVSADYRYLVDNLMDLSHLAFVHANSIGSSGDTNPSLTWSRGSDLVRGVRIATTFRRRRVSGSWGSRAMSTSPRTSPSWRRRTSRSRSRRPGPALAPVTTTA